MESIHPVFHTSLVDIDYKGKDSFNPSKDQVSRILNIFETPIEYIKHSKILD